MSNQKQLADYVMKKRRNVLAALAEGVSAHVVADYILLQTEDSADDGIGNVKLNCALYFIQGAYMNTYKHQLFYEDFEAWAICPIIPDIYQRFKKYGRSWIDPYTRATKPLDLLSKEEQHFIDETWEAIRRYTGVELRNAARNEAWQETRKGLNELKPCYKVIPKPNIKESVKKIMREKMKK